MSAEPAKAWPEPDELPVASRSPYPRTIRIGRNALPINLAMICDTSPAGNRGFIGTGPDGFATLTAL